MVVSFVSIHRMRLNDKPFRMIKSGIKNVELRLYDEKRKELNIGDEIIFESLKNGETITTTVLNLHIYKSFEELYKHFDKISMGYEDNEIASPEDMNEYYTPEKQEKYGVVGIEISLQVPNLSGNE